METNQTQSTQQLGGNYSMPSQIKEVSDTMASLTKLLLEVSNTLIAMRREFRGEAMFQDEEGGSHWIQISKPAFVKINFVTGKPRMKKVMMPWNEDKLIYIPNDEAIDEVLSMLKFAGVNQISPIGFNPENNYQDDLREFECKLAAVLALKQKEWGLDKELLPMIMFKIKTLVQDVRSMSVKGGTLKAIQTTVSRIEQVMEGERNKKPLSPY